MMYSVKYARNPQEVQYKTEEELKLLFPEIDVLFMNMAILSQITLRTKDKGVVMIRPYK